MTVTVVKPNSLLDDLRNSIDGRSGSGGQSLKTRVSPEGTVALPGIGTVRAHGFTLEELKHEVNTRYADLVHGIEITPLLVQRAERFVFVVGEVDQPGRFQLTGPTSVLQAIALAGGHVVGAKPTTGRDFPQR